MRGVFTQSWRAVAACLLVVVLLVPSAFASDPPRNESLWGEFLTWVQSRLGIPGGVAAADESSFTVWLMGRLNIPGG